MEARAYDRMLDRTYTFNDYMTWESKHGVRAEIIDGVIYNQAASTHMHQEISVEIERQLTSYLFGKNSKMLHAPYTVRLDDKTVVEPDILVICDRRKIRRWGCNGAPDLIIEILSPSTARNDTILKLNKYMRHGVQEYWIVHPTENLVTVHRLQNGAYTFQYYHNEESIPVSVLDGCEIDLRTVFQGDMFAQEEEAPRVTDEE